MARGFHVLGFAALLVLLGCPSGDVELQASEMPPVSESDESGSGLELRLGETAASDGQAPERAPIAPAALLSEDATAAVLARLPALAVEPSDARDFALRDGSLPPPRTGATIVTPFPPPSTSEARDVDAKPPTVLRRAPEGDVPLAPQISITFSEPMVPITSDAVLTATDVPARLTPEVAGEWRWVGTKTLFFEPKTRLPMATEYRVELPAGVRSAAGVASTEPAAWTFRTPPPVLGRRHPADGSVDRRDPIVFAELDQKIDPQAVLRAFRILPAQPQLRLATAEEVAANPTVRDLAAQATDGRWLAFVPVAPLPADAQVTVELAAGAPSLEGPRRTEKPQSWSFRTYGPLRVVAHDCARSDACPPGTPWAVRFSNPLDPSAFDASSLRVDPPLGGLEASASWSSLWIQPQSKGRTKYRLTLPASLADAFGQTLGQEQTLEFEVGSAPPSLQGKSGLVVLDPTAPPRFSVYTVNEPSLRVRAYRVTTSSWSGFQPLMQSVWDEQLRLPDAPLAFDTTVATQGAPDELTETAIDLAPALDDGLGHVVVIVEPARQPRPRERLPRVVSWVQATQIGLDAFADTTRLLAWVTSLRDGRPLADVELSLSPTLLETRTNPDGTTTFELGDVGAELLIARSGKDVAFLPSSQGGWWSTGVWKRRPQSRDHLWYVFDDRKMYRPGETVKVKGWIRQLGAGPTGDVGPLPRNRRTVRYVAIDSRGNEVAKSTGKIDAFGGFDLSISLPSTMNLGTAQIGLELPGAGHTHFFEVQEFRRPEFEVTAAPSEGPYRVGESASILASAAYYAGGPLPDAPVTWTVTSTPGSYTPPNRDDFTFGEWVPWWLPWSEPQPSRTETFSSKTDPAGKHSLTLDFIKVDPPRPTNVRASAAVMDVNRQEWAVSTELLVHPSELYVGIRSERLFVQRGEKLAVDAIVTDIDGKAIVDRPFTMTAERLVWRQVKGEWREVPEDAQECGVTSATDPVRCDFEAREGGRWRVTARVVDDRQRPNRSRLQLWVAGGSLPPSRDVEQQEVQLIPDRKEYGDGDTAEILVLAPFAPAEGLLTLRRSGLLRHERFTMAQASHTLRIPIEEGFTPEVHAQVDLVGKAPRAGDDGETDPALASRPAFAAGTISLAVPPAQRTLDLRVTPRVTELEPGGSTTLDVELRDAAGRPVADGQVAVVVVDEAVLSLTGYRLPDPLALFYGARQPGVEDWHLRANVLLGKPTNAALEEITVTASKLLPAAPAAMDLQARLTFDAASLGEPPVRLRTDFAALALFAASVPTDPRGRADVPVTLPDSLTRYRVMAVAATRTNAFGKGEATLTARLPLMVRPSAPRFLSFGDRFELPVVLQNQTDDALDVELAARATNLDLTDGAGRRVTVPARDRVEVRLPAAARAAGTARVQIAGRSGDFSDAAEISLPVWTPATTEAFATYGQIDSGATEQRIAPPSGVVAQFGGLEITTSSTAVQALTDAVLYLVAYPFECSEQLASRVLAIAALRDVLAAFDAEGLPEPKELVDAVDRDIARLAALQNDDGGFAFWRRGDESWPYLSIHAAHAIERARQKGFEVPARLRERAKAYLAAIQRNIPNDYPPELKRTLEAYALYVRQLMGDPDPRRARAIVTENGVESLPIESLGWLLPILSKDPASAADVAAIRRHLANRATETAATATFAASYGEQGPHLLLHSSRRTDAILLEALIGDSPQSDLIPKLVEGLLAQRVKGRWQSTQENAFVLLALDRYFGTYEKATPDFVARAWLGDRLAVEQTFRGRSTDRASTIVPMRALAEIGPAPLVVAKDGPGRLYYRLGLRYAPESLELEPLDRGFAVEREYEAVDDPADVRRDDDGTWRIRSGARVRVRLTMAAEARRYHVALVDPLPAGLEPLNPALAVTGALPPDEPDTADLIGAPGLGGPRGVGSYAWWRRTWYEHQNLRDERVEAFTSLLFEGVYTYTYIARATTPGQFIAAPARAEEMYYPETFGRTGTDRVIVE